MKAMKKYVKLLVCLILATVLLLSVTACFERPVDPVIPETPEGPVDTTIDDAYESNRPDYDGEFDYDSGYTPTEPTEPVEEFFTVTIDANSPVKFADGSTSKEVKKGDALTLESFDLSGIPDSRELVGFAGTDGDGERTILDIEDCRIWEDLTILPYFSPESGFKALDIGSGKIGRFNLDGVPGSIAVNKTIKYDTNEIVAGGSGGYAELGGLITETSPVTIGSAFRLDSTCTVTEGVWEVAYNFENKGDEELHLDVYQVSKGAEYNNGNLSYENTRYRVDVDLKPGESMRGKGQYYLTSNGNILPYIVADRSMSSMKFGMTLSVKARTDLTEPETKPSPEPTPTAKLSFKLPEGITVNDDYKTDVAFGATVIPPTSAQITNTTGRTIGGWYIVGDSLEFVTASTSMPEVGLTIAPYFAPAVGEPLVYGSGTKAGDSIVDYFGNTAIEPPEEDSPDYPDYAAKYDTSKFGGKDVIVNDERAVRLTHNGTLDENDYFRVKTSAELLKNYKYKYYYTFTNNGESSISFDLWQLRSMIDMADDGAVSTSVTVPAGKTVNAVIEEIKYAAANTNALTMLVMKGETKDLDITVKTAYENLGEDQTADKYALTIGGETGITFADGSTTAMISEGSAVPEVKNNTGRTIAGWYGKDGNKISSFEMPAKATTIYPYFEVASGYKRLWLHNGKNEGTPDPSGGGFIDGSVLVRNNFEPLTNGKAGFGNENEAMKTIVRGTDGFAEEGMLLKYTGQVPAGEMWRCDSVINGGENPFQLKLNNTYDYSFNFQNKGDENINFEIYIINSGQDLTSCENNNMTVVLGPGEYKTIAAEDVLYKKAYANQPNNNMLMRFLVKESITNGFALGVSISAKIPT